MISAYSPKACPPASRRSRPRTAAMGPGRVLLTRAFIGPGRSPRQSRTVLCDVLMHPGTAGAATGEHLTCRASRRAEQRQHGRLPGGEVDRQTDLDSYEQPRGGADEQHRDLVRLDVTTDARTACPSAAPCESRPTARARARTRSSGDSASTTPRRRSRARGGSPACGCCTASAVRPRSPPVGPTSVTALPGGIDVTVALVGPGNVAACASATTTLRPSRRGGLR